MSNKWLIFALLYLVCQFCVAQQDSLYIKSYKHIYGVKLYMANDNLSFEYEFQEKNSEKFMPNKPVNIGVGFSWKNSSLSYSYGFSFLRDKKKGKTKSRDIQYHYYGDKIVIDLYYQRYKGFYLEGDKNEPYNLFNNLSINYYGISGQYIFNNKRYSAAAAFDQSKKQIRSAGSLLLGGGVFYNKIKNLPEVREKLKDYDRVSYNFGPNVGYGYNWVPLKNLLLAGSFSVGINGVFDKNLESNETTFRVNPQLTGRFSVMYQSEDWIVGVSSLVNNLYVSFKDDYQSSILNTNLTLSVIKRFTPKKEWRLLKYDFTDLFKKTEEEENIK